MYPDKIKRLVIDGVVDGHSYRTSGYDTDIVDGEAIVESLFTYCHQAGLENCPLYDTSVDRIRDRFYKVLKEVEGSPVPVALADTPVVITRKALLNQLFKALYSPIKAFPTVAAAIYALETRDTNALVALAKKEGVFLMEAMWTRFQPVARKLREIIEGGELGRPVVVDADLSGDFDVDSA